MYLSTDALSRQEGSFTLIEDEPTGLTVELAIAVIFGQHERHYRSTGSVCEEKVDAELLEGGDDELRAQGEELGYH